MKKLFLMSGAAAALVGASGVAIAQAPNEKPNSPVAQSAPTEKVAPVEKVAPQSSRGETPNAKSDAASKAGRADKTTLGDKGGAQHAQEKNSDAEQPRGSVARQKPEIEPSGKSSADMKANGKLDAGRAASETNAGTQNGMKTDSKTTADTKSSATVGQAGAGSKQLTTEQRSTIRTAIKDQHVRPVQNVNFSISIGTQVPRTVNFYPLPTQMVSIYPDWRGYEYFLVGDQIIVVNPRTFEIVAVLEA
ncbi:MAG: DUF1236 domain-containing protein [Bradyrhizobiaceae bacterium]|nr:MAG: DUF1236 domain-containing protein [Bradyrhizobiaceae bacterium]